MLRPGLRAFFVAALVLGTLLVPATAGMPGPLGSLEKRGPIAILSDAGFTAANGVRSGTGAPGDPYVISGWSINTASTAVKISGVTKSFVLRDNLLIVTGSATAITIENVQGASAVADNDVRYHTGKGISVKDATITIRDNALTGAGETYVGGIGIDLERSNSAVVENVVSESVTGIKARYGNPFIQGNNIGQIKDGILLEHGAAGANVTGNVVANGHGKGIWVNYGTNVSVHANLVEHMKTGIEAWNCITTEIRGNLVQDTQVVGILLEGCNMTVAYNIVADGKAGIQVWQSDAVLLGNEIRNHLAIGVEWMMSEGSMEANVIHRNAYGIYLHDDNEVRMRFNTMTNNTIGLHIPYEARQSIFYMQGNLVNNISVDGHFNASQRAFYYRAANVVVANATIDSGFSAGYYGAISSQGAITLYEVNTARIEGSVLAHNKIGVYAVNSFNVQINGSLILNNEVGVQLEVKASMGTPVPTCVGFVKNTTIIIEVDPPATFGVRNIGCLGGVYNSTFANVDVGIYFNDEARGWIVGNHVSYTTTGVWIEGNPGEPNDVVIAHDNVVAVNKVGFLLRASGAHMANNRISDNTREGIKLEVGAHPVLIGNNVTRNRDGVLDKTACGTTGASCSRIPLARGNYFGGNEDRGIVVNGGGTFTSNLIVENGGHGAEVKGDVVFRQNVVAANGGDGAHLSGFIDISKSRFTANAKSGVVLHGTVAARDSEFTLNAQAGIYAEVQWLTALHLNISGNLDGLVAYEGLPAVGVPAAPYPYIQPGDLYGGGSSVPGTSNAIVRAIVGTDPIFIHRSIFEDNERNAVRAGAAVVNATHNYWGSSVGPTLDTGVTGQWGNSVSAHVHHTPWYVDRAMTETGPIGRL